MKLKQIILIVIVIAALAGAGVFIYLSFSGSTTPSASSGTAIVNSPILPNGNKLNFDKINKFNQTGHTFQYPTVGAADTGLGLNDIISQ